MKVQQAQSVTPQAVDMPGAAGCQVRWLINADDGAPNFAMRQFDVAVGGHTPRHSHPYEHEVYVLEGAGVVWEGDREHPLRGGDVVLVRPGEIHQFRNTGQVLFKFLCIIPHAPPGQPATQAPECGAGP